MSKVAKLSSKNFRITLFITYIAILSALSVVCNIFTIPISGGTKAISFGYLPPMIAGVFLGPIPGFAVGVLGDVLGQIIHPLGPWIPTMTLSSGLLGLIPALMFKIPKLNPYIKIVLSFTACFLLCTFLINTLSTYKVYVIDRGGSKTFWFYVGERLGFMAIVVVINCVIYCLLHYPLKRFVFDKLGGRVATGEDIEAAEAAAEAEVAASAWTEANNDAQYPNTVNVGAGVSETNEVAASAWTEASNDAQYPSTDNTGASETNEGVFSANADTQNDANSDKKLD